MYHVIDETLAGWWRLQAQEGGQPAVLLNNDAIHVQQSSDIRTLRGDGNRQCSQEDSGGHPDNQKCELLNILATIEVKASLHVSTRNEQDTSASHLG